MWFFNSGGSESRDHAGWSWYALLMRSRILVSGSMLGLSCSTVGISLVVHGIVCDLATMTGLSLDVAMNEICWSLEV
jgi:hypothetical protein